jgi:hypothetical protein
VSIHGQSEKRNGRTGCTGPTFWVRGGQLGNRHVSIHGQSEKRNGRTGCTGKPPGWASSESGEGKGRKEVKK